jgi:hypothetical protein
VRRTAFNTPSLLPCLLATREATCANSTSYRGNFPSLDVLPWACHWAGRGEVESEESPTGRVPTRTPHTSRTGASPAARMAPWALAWLPAVTPRSPSRPSRPTKNAKRAARRHSVPPLAAPLPERNPEVLTAALSCWNWLIAATPRQQLGRISPAYSAKWLNNLKSIIPMEEDTGRAPSRLHVVSDFLHWEFGRRPVGELPFSEPMGGVARQGKKRPTAGYRSR